MRLLISSGFPYVFSRFGGKQPQHQQKKKENESIKTHSTLWIQRKRYATILEHAWYSASGFLQMKQA